MMTPPKSLSLIVEVARLLRRRFEQHAQSLGLTRLQWMAIAYLSKNEGIHQKSLAELLEVEPITLVRILDQLAARGFVERRAHPTDRRLWLLHTCEAVQPLLSQIHDLGDLVRAEALSDIAPDRLEAAFDVLHELKSNLLAQNDLPAADEEQNHG
jgi:DNA-binding MarR family transcriptional regulator